MSTKRLLIVEEDRVVRDLLTRALAGDFALRCVSCVPAKAVAAARGFRPQAVLLGRGGDRGLEFRTLVELRRALPDLPLSLFGPNYLPGSPFVRRALSLGGVTRAPWPGVGADGLEAFAQDTLAPWLVRLYEREEEGSRPRYADERLAPGDEAWLRELVRHERGLVLEGAAVQLQIRLLPLLLSYGYTGVAELVSEVRTAEAGLLHEEILDRLTDQPVGFFRPRALYEALEAELLPEHLEARPDGPLSVWSADCGVGAGAYTLALVLERLLGAEAAAEVRHLATDPSACRIERARTGCFDLLEVCRGLEGPDRDRFEPAGAVFQAEAGLRASLDFRVLAVGDTPPPFPEFDVITFGRPLSSYVPAVRAGILELLTERLAPGGLLLLDQEDGVWGRQNGLCSERRGSAVVHRRVA